MENREKYSSPNCQGCCYYCTCSIFARISFHIVDHKTICRFPTAGLPLFHLQVRKLCSYIPKSLKNLEKKKRCRLLDQNCCSRLMSEKKEHIIPYNKKLVPILCARESYLSLKNKIIFQKLSTWDCGKNIHFCTFIFPHVLNGSCRKSPLLLEF